MKTKINQIWIELAQSSRVQNRTSGFVTRLIDSEFKSNIKLGILCKENHRCLLIQVSRIRGGIVNAKTNLKGVKLSSRSKRDDKSNYLLCLELVENNLIDVFTVLCVDITNHVKDITNDKLLVTTFLNRIEHWKYLFKEAKEDGLTPEAQQGLYGELHFLHKYFLKRKIYNVEQWKGGEKATKDFQSDNFAVEVKTSISGKNSNFVKINGEYQLDKEGFSELFLYHLICKKNSKNGETLNNLVYRIRTILNGNIDVLTTFNQKMIEYGYREIHISKYEETKYLIISEEFYRIEGNFPRIDKNLLPIGIDKVVYTLNLDNCNSYRIVATDFIDKISNNE